MTGNSKSMIRNQKHNGRSPTSNTEDGRQEPLRIRRKGTTTMTPSVEVAHSTTLKTLGRYTKMGIKAQAGHWSMTHDTTVEAGNKVRGPSVETNTHRVSGRATRRTTRTAGRGHYQLKRVGRTSMYGTCVSSEFLISNPNPRFLI